MEQATCCRFGPNGRIIVTSTHDEAWVLAGATFDPASAAPSASSARPSARGSASSRGSWTHDPSTHPTGPFLPLYRLGGLGGGAWSACFSRSGRYAFVGSEDNAVAVYDLQAAQAEMRGGEGGDGHSSLEQEGQGLQQGRRRAKGAKGAKGLQQKQPGKQRASTDSGEGRSGGVLSDGTCALGAVAQAAINDRTNRVAAPGTIKVAAPSWEWRGHKFGVRRSPWQLHHRSM